MGVQKPPFLDFEKPLQELDKQIKKIKEVESTGVDITQTLKELTDKRKEQTKEIYNNLTAWQKVQVSRHPERPYTLSYINAITEGEFIELHGDRNVKDDKAMVGGFGMLDGKSVMFVGQQKGVNTKAVKRCNITP